MLPLDYLDRINIIDLTFLTLAFVATFTGVLINHFEKYVPVFVIKGYKYGSFAYQGSEANFLQVIEIPKAYYRHFYLFSSILCVCTLFYMNLVYFFGYSMNKYIPLVLRGLLQEYESSVCVSGALIIMVLFTLQCLRRWYETYYLQVFAKSSKMNLSHYMAGIAHYFACTVVFAGQAPLFCGNQDHNSIVWMDTRTKVFAIPCAALFLWAWHEQYKANVIFANLRKDKKSGKVVTEEHGVPRGRLFEYVSSPHRFCEVLMYTTLLALIPTKTYFCIYLWVLGNQFQTAIQAHEWYKAAFKNYPKHRQAILPHLL